MGGRRGDIQAAIVAATVANAARGKKGRRAQVTDFLPPWSKPERPEQSPQQMWAAVARLNTQLGGDVQSD